MDLQFYPTPRRLAVRLWGLFQNKDFRRVLDPSAGEGALLEAAPNFEDFRHYRHRRFPLDAVEIDVTKHPGLRSKGFSVVGLDFLQFNSASIYSHIVLNPPFSEGAKHVLHAWNILWDGEIAAIVNAETIRNPFSVERQQLVRLIEQHGSVKFVAGAFEVPEAERKTSVDVALVYLRKQADVQQEIIGDLLGDLKRDATGAADLAGGYQAPHALALPESAIENSVLAFNAAVRSMREATAAQARAGYYASLVGQTMAERNGDTKPEAGGESSVAWVQNTVAEGYEKLKDAAWAGILRSTNVTSRLSSGAQQRVEAEFQEIKRLEFTVSNIYGFLHGLIQSQSNIQLGMACDVFDLITKYHSDNTCYYRGWRSNDKHRTCGMRIKTTRFVLPGHSTDGWRSSPDWKTTQLLADFDKVFALLDGKAEPEIPLRWIFEQRFSDLRHGARVSSSYFDVRYYPGIGTIHFFARDKKLIDRLNRLVGRHRQWLPPEGARVSEAFWLQFDQAEKFDKELRAEVSKNNRDRWGDPFWRLSRNQTDAEAREASAAIDAAAATVLERRGIKVDFQLQAQPEAARGATLALPLAA